MSEQDGRLTLKQVLDAAIQIEQAAAGLYRRLHARFSHHPRSAALWEAMAADEDGHARFLREVEARSPGEILALPATAETVAKVLRVSRLSGQDLLSPIRTLRDAYDVAHQLESSEINAILEFLVTEALPGDFEPEFIRGHITAHQQRLTDFRQSTNPSTWTRVTARTSSP